MSARLPSSLPDSIQSTGPAMPGFGWQLNDEQVAAVASYVRNRFAHAPAVTAEQAAQTRADLASITN
ncbi:MAG TPA: hypothetical protein VKY22_16450 [Bradyrhizobium sp.]|nr:hypothetical protein [Bradyrhizobium sp.]